MATHGGEGYIVEFVQIGQSVKVSAVDTKTGREVSIVGPAHATRQHLTQLAVKKLEYVLAQKK